MSFGVQRIGGGYEELRELLATEGVKPRTLSASEVVLDPQDKHGKRIHQDTFFRLLGFESVESIDYFPDEGPTHQLDLNQPLPDALQGRYDFVCDAGTTEHCFNVPQVLTNTLELLRPGGTVVHVTPITGWLTHGFYQLCPSLFFHFYAENGFTGLNARINYGGRSLDPAEYMPTGDFLGRKALLIFVARKPEEAAELRWPVQGEYSSERIERTVKAFGLDRQVEDAKDPRSVYSPRAWSSDLGAFLKQYLRLSKRSRVLKK